MQLKQIGRLSITISLRLLLRKRIITKDIEASSIKLSNLNTAFLATAGSCGIGSNAVGTISILQQSHHIERLSMSARCAHRTVGSRTLRIGAIVIGK